MTKASQGNSREYRPSALFQALQSDQPTFQSWLKYFLFFLAELGLHCCTWAFSSCGEQGLLFIVVLGLLTAVASLIVQHGIQACGLSSCGTQVLECGGFSGCGARAQLLGGMWDLPGPGIEPMSPALAGGFLTTAPPGKSLKYFLNV